MKRKNQAAVALGKLAKGKPKKYSPAQIKLRTARIKAARKAYLEAAKLNTTNQL